MSDTPPVLITGGAGYIGSHAILAFAAAGHQVIVLDDLSTGRREAVPDSVPLIQGDVGDSALVAEIIRTRRIGAVIHFAGSIIVPESVSDPLKYYRNNTGASRTLIETCIACGLRHIIFSSTAAVYGIPERAPVREDAPTAPINPYGASKLMTEWMLRDAAAAHDLAYVALRYFNVAGADPQGRSGQRSKSATHLIEVATRAALGQRDHVEIFGDDFDTPDGTGVRDYIHVTDLAEAHVLALKHLKHGGETGVFNLGNERGFSVREVLDTVRRVSGSDFEIKMGPRRPGDPACLVADAARARETLGWCPSHSELTQQVTDALNWHKKRLQAPRAAAVG